MVATQFVALVRATAKARGRGSVAIVELPYTIASASGEWARELADKSLEDTINALTKCR